MADDNDTRDWAADCNGEGRGRVARNSGDSGVVMMAAVAKDGCVADDDGEGRQ